MSEPVLEPGLRPEQAPPAAVAWPHAVRGVHAAFLFLTRIPLGDPRYVAADWAWASAHFPLVGAVLGALLGGLDRLLLPLGSFPAALLVVGASMLLTGAFHEDGLADTSDALGGAYDRQKVLEILKDSRIGSFGAAALVVSIVGRAALIARLGGAGPWALCLVGCGARVGPVWLMRALPYVTRPELSRSRDISLGRTSQALVATAWFALAGIAGIALGRYSASRLSALALGLAAVAVLCGWRFRRRVGGVTGDFLGATEQLGELMGLAVLAWGL